MDWGDNFSCVVCSVGLTSESHGDNPGKSNNKGDRFRDVWEIFLDLFQLIHTDWIEIERYFVDKNVIPFCNRCEDAFSALLTLRESLQQGPDLLVARNVNMKTRFETRIKHAIIESEESTSWFNGGFNVRPFQQSSDVSLLETKGDIIRNRISCLRKSILRGKDEHLFKLN